MQARPVNGNLIVFLRCLLEVMKILHVSDFDAKVVNDEAKVDGPPHVAPQSGHVLALIVPLGGKTFFQQLACKNAGLGEIVHPHLDLDVDPSIELGNVARVIGEYNFFGNDVEA
jgi:hypothetical protein